MLDLPLQRKIFLTQNDMYRPIAQECPALSVGLLDDATAVVLDDAGHVTFFALA